MLGRRHHPEALVTASPRGGEGAALPFPALSQAAQRVLIDSSNAL